MIKRKPLPKDQSNMYVYTRDVINKWVIEELAEKKKKERENEK